MEIMKKFFQIRTKWGIAVTLIYAGLLIGGYGMFTTGNSDSRGEQKDNPPIMLHCPARPVDPDSRLYENDSDREQGFLAHHAGVEPDRIATRSCARSGRGARSTSKSINTRP